MKSLARIIPDKFILYLLCTVLIASLLPAHGVGVKVFSGLTNIAVALLFFLHGARLSRESVLAGLTHWRLQALILGSTFILFPIMGLLLHPLLGRLMTPELYSGVIFLCCLPSTVQSSIAFTSMARGNVPAAVCAASGSSLLGIFITPLLVGLIMSNAGSGGTPISFDAVLNIVEELLVPFLLGQILRRWIGAWVHRRKSLLKIVDQGSILLVVYSAFSEAVREGIWHTTSIGSLVGLVVGCIVLLALALCITFFGGRALGLKLPDNITLLFCGSKKSLASGVPMAQVLFAGHAVGAIVLPLMLFHQIQLMTCAVLAGRWARRPETDE